MSKRCKLQKEYHQKHGNYKGNGTYSDKYVAWLEEQVIGLQSDPLEQKRCLMCNTAVYNNETICNNCK